MSHAAHGFGRRMAAHACVVLASGCSVIAFHAAPVLAQATSANLSCTLSSSTAAPATSVTLDVFLQNAADVRGYQVQIEITRTSGTGEVTVPCPGGVTVDENRPDFIFLGLDTNLTPDCTDCGVIVPHCEGMRVAVARVAGGVNVGTTRAYLASFTLDISADVTPASSFEISIRPYPASIVGASNNNSIPFIPGPPCILGGAIPTLSAWGVVVLTLLLLIAAKLYFGRRRLGTPGSIARAILFIAFALIGGFSTLAGPPCNSNTDCDDGNICTFDQCPANSCSNTLASHADVANDQGCGPDGTVDTLDITAFEDGFRGSFAPGCALHNLDIEDGSGCGPDGRVDLFDLFGVLGAFSGRAKCACPPVADSPDERPPIGEEPASPCACASCGTGAESIHGSSGEFTESAVDLHLPGRGIDFVWSRKYRSRLGSDTAQGHGWDFSYDIRVEKSGPHRILSNGDGRRDLYRLQPDGTWTRREFFRVLKQNPDLSYTLTFADRGQWNFHALNGGVLAGKIRSIADRNGNTLNLAYDGLGRLTKIHDALDTPAHNRDITIAYNVDGLIASVSDWTGRQVTYEYYNGIEPGGNFGDLKSVTTPAVVNSPDFPIPPGHDYLSGKTTGYRYSTGFVDERLNHNLLTITDPKGRTYVVNEYAATTDVHDFDFDRVSKQTRGAPGEAIKVEYVPQTPGLANHNATRKAIINDRVGNVSEHFYDDDNRVVMEREYTGRGAPTQPTTDTENRPTGKLRPSDPDYYETVHEYNDDSLRTRTVHPNGNVEVYEYDDVNPARRAQGNLVEHRRLPGPLGGDQTQIVETFEYDDGFGGCCGTNFVKKHTDARGNVTEHTYDANGNRTHSQYRIPTIIEDWEYNPSGQMTKHVLPDNGSGHRRRDEYTYYPAGPQAGYLHEGIIDAGWFGLTTTYEYDVVGNVTRTIDPRGHDSRTIYNPLNQPVRTISREVADGSGIRYETDTYYDANDKVVRVDVQNKDLQGVLQPNTHFTTIHEYDILNYPKKTCTESGAFNVPPGQSSCAGLPESEFITTITEYDANRNPVKERAGESVNGNQPNNETSTEYDERDLIFRTTRAPADAGKSTTQRDYDANGNATRTIGGTEDLLNPRITVTEYDGYNRAIRTTDPMGNETTTHYDPNGNRVSTRTDGALTNDLPGGAGNVRLTETIYIYDAMDRSIRTDAAFFDTQTQTPIGDGLATTTTEYTDNSQVRRVVDDNSHQTVTTYDTANRQRSVTDHKGNSVTYAYDANSNVVATTEVEKSDIGNPDQSYTTVTEYDNLDRAITTTDNVGNVMQSFYDSRSNRTRSIDALNHEVRNTFDGLSRGTATVRDMDGDGADGDGPDITTGQAWDDDSRLTGQTDDNNNTTAPEFDALNREVATDMADCTEPTKQYDVHHNLIQETDANGTVVTYRYDLLNRVTEKMIVPGPNVSPDTTQETYAYDGLSRLTRAQDDDSRVTREYDSLSNVTKEVQNQVPPFNAVDDRVVTSTYDGEGNKLTCTYPGGRVITTTYDELDRKKTITDTTGAPQLIATYDYIGPGRVERRTYGNGARTDYSYDGIAPNPPGDFGVKSIIRARHTVTGTPCANNADCQTGATCVAGFCVGVIDDRTFIWDRMGNKTQRKDVRAGGPQLTHNYGYDSVYRLTDTTVLDSISAVVRDTDYALDGVGNRLSVTGPGTPDAGNYSLVPLCDPMPADYEVNQYTSTPIDARQYDDNGNLVLIDELPPGPPTLRNIKYDYRNQMVQHTDAAAISTYRYDALGRRVRKTVDVNGVSGGPMVTRFYLDGWQEIEEQDAAGTTTATYTFGLYIDEVLTMRRPSCLSAPVPPCLDFFYHTDDLYNVMAVTDAAGAVVERYEYQDYGDPKFMDAASIDIPQSTIDNSLLFTGRRYEPETESYFYRTRFLDPRAGRFMTRDTIGIWGDEQNLGNGYSYVSLNPISSLDPTGRDQPGCDSIAKTADPCKLECCAIHDYCFDVHNCTWHSWAWTFSPLAIVSPCARCNLNAASCIADCIAGLRRADPLRPKYYSAEHHQFVEALPGADRARPRGNIKLTRARTPQEYRAFRLEEIRQEQLEFEQRQQPRQQAHEQRQTQKQLQFQQSQLAKQQAHEEWQRQKQLQFQQSQLAKQQAHEERQRQKQLELQERQRSK